MNAKKFDAAVHGRRIFVLGVIGVAAVVALVEISSRLAVSRCGALQAKARAVYVCANTRGCAVQLDDLETLYVKSEWFQQHCTVKP